MSPNTNKFTVRIRNSESGKEGRIKVGVSPISTIGRVQNAGLECVKCIHQHFVDPLLDSSNTYLRDSIK